MKKLILVVGSSGAGKSVVQDYISKEYGYTPIHSMTTRKQRNEHDIHHKFVTRDEMLAFDERELIAHDAYPDGKGGEVHYASHVSDFGEKSVYVIEENGLLEVLKRMSRHYDVYCLFIHRHDDHKVGVDGERLSRDHGQLRLPDKVYEGIIENTGSLEELYVSLDEFMNIVEKDPVFIVT